NLSVAAAAEDLVIRLLEDTTWGQVLGTGSQGVRRGGHDPRRIVQLERSWKNAGAKDGKRFKLRRPESRMGTETFAARCHRLSARRMVRRGSTVRVRQRALQKPRTWAFHFGSICRLSNVEQVWSPLWSLQVEDAFAKRRFFARTESDSRPIAPSQVHSGARYDPISDPCIPVTRWCGLARPSLGADRDEPPNVRQNFGPASGEISLALPTLTTPARGRCADGGSIRRVHRSASGAQGSSRAPSLRRRRRS